jgi:hypothetical protein
MQPTPDIRESHPGGKGGAGVYQTLINLMPPHEVYIEPFLGHGTILLKKRPALLSIGLDLDPQAVQVVRAHLTAAIVRDVVSGSASHVADDAADASRVPHRQHGIPCSVAIPDEPAGAAFTIGSARYQLCVGDGIDFLRAYQFTGTELVYCDPPYVRSARRSPAKLYHHEMDDRQHAELLTILRSLTCFVMVSGYHSALYDERLGDWRTITYQGRTRGRTATEVVWMNYAEPADRHDYRYLGANFRARERQTRQQKRWATKVDAKPQLEQVKLIAGLLARVDPTVKAAVLRSALADSEGEALIARNGTAGSHTILSDDTFMSGGAGSHTTLSGDTTATPTQALTAAPPRRPRCTICRSPDRARIDQALAAGASVREVARLEGVSKSVVGRHLDHSRKEVVSQFASGTIVTPPHQDETPHTVQLDLLSLE